MTIGIVSVFYGEYYQTFLRDWAESIAQLEKKPDHIAIVCDKISSSNKKNLYKTLDSSIDIIITKSIPQCHAKILINEAVLQCNTEWICKMDADDRFFPHALNKLDSIDEDVFMFGLLLTQWKNKRLIGNPIAMYAQHANTEMIKTSSENLVFNADVISTITDSLGTKTFSFF